MARSGALGKLEVDGVKHYSSELWIQVQVSVISIDT